MSNKSTVVTRFAPSPTGFLHIGSVRTALYGFLYAKKHGGEFILRIEDTDKSREVKGSIEHIVTSLRWLGIQWTYGPDTPGPFGSCLQSERLDIYRRYAEALLEKGLAYPDPYTSEEVESFREEAKAKKEVFLFRNHRPRTTVEWDGKTPLRFKTPVPERVVWNDSVRGELSAGPEALDDFIILKADGFPTYNFAHIIDDYEMGVTHVMRGEEFISSTPKYIALYSALEIPQPAIATLPPIMGPDGKKKLSKRDGAKDLLDYEKEGYLPQAMMNFLALIGWNPGGDQEIFDMSELVHKFELEDIQHSGGAFNEEKLTWMNGVYLKALTPEEQFAYVQEALPSEVTNASQYSDERLQRFLPTLLERVEVAKDIALAYREGEYDWLLETPSYETGLLAWKNDASVTAASPRLEKVSELLLGADFSSSETLKEAIWPYAEEEGRGEVLWPLRVALTGKERSPDPFTCLHILGKEESTLRVEAAVRAIESA